MKCPAGDKLSHSCIILLYSAKFFVQTVYQNSAHAQTLDPSSKLPHLLEISRFIALNCPGKFHRQIDAQQAEA